LSPSVTVPKSCNSASNAILGPPGAIADRAA
jgi:hypothetical protein